MKYDAVILGGRIAGAATAIGLARKGLKVAVVEAAPRGANTLSTHFLWPRAMAYLRRLGVSGTFEKCPAARTRIRFSLDGVAIEGAVPAHQTAARLHAVHGESPALATETYACIRRQALDTYLIDAAAEAGADVFLQTRMESTLRQDGRIVALKCRAPGGTLSLQADVFIAADGRASPLAAAIQAPIVDYRDVCTSSCWSYFSGLPAMDVRLAKRGAAGFGAATTNDGMTMVLVWGPKHAAPTYLKATDKVFSSLVAAVDPAFADRLRTQGEREERFYRAANLASHKRASAFGNVLFAGDAACFKDQCTASGILHALRDAELAVDAIADFQAGRATLSEAQRTYAAKREADTEAYFDFACASAAMEPATADEKALVAACQRNPDLAANFLSACGDSLPLAQLAQCLDKDRHASPRHPSLS